MVLALQFVNATQAPLTTEHVSNRAHYFMFRILVHVCSTQDVPFQVHYGPAKVHSIDESVEQLQKDLKVNEAAY